MNMSKKIAFAYTWLALCTSGVHAATANLSLSGNISTVCSFGAPTAGTLAMIPTAPNTMGTGVAGGNAASVTAYYVARQPSLSARLLLLTLALRCQRRLRSPTQPAQPMAATLHSPATLQRIKKLVARLTPLPLA